MATEAVSSTVQGSVWTLIAEGWCSSWERWFLWIGGAFTAILVAICYGFAFKLPFFYDDLPTMTWVGHHSWSVDR